MNFQFPPFFKKIILFQGWGDRPTGKVLVLNHEALCLISKTQAKSAGIVEMLVSPELGRQRQADLWGSLTDRPRGCMVPEENAGDCLDLHIHTDTYAYVLAHTSGPAHT